jgi:hypothetical protein
LRRDSGDDFSPCTERILRREDFTPRASHCGNKSSAKLGSGDEDVAIFAAASTALGGEPISSIGILIFPERMFRPPHQEIADMRQFRSLLRSARSRIGRRFAEIVAIAAASLPAVGA